jgi:hypothetical protein
MDKQALIDLAARSEAATGPDRELDLAVWRAIDPNASDLDAKGKVLLPWLWCVTSSVDAAMTLVPDRCQFGAGRDNLVEGPPGWAWVSDSEDFEVVRAATPTLALTAACLRALASGGGV